LQQTQFLPGKLAFYGRVLKTLTCIRKVADEIRIMIVFKFVEIQEIKEFVVTSKN
jgi:hypothetical protein